MKPIDDERMTIQQAASRLGAHVATVYRWALRGVRGQRLETLVIGGRRYVTEAGLDNFIKSLNSGATVHQHDDRDIRRQLAEYELDGLGVGGEDPPSHGLRQRAAGAPDTPQRAGCRADGGHGGRRPRHKPRRR